jgi:hypothetical protein
MRHPIARPRKYKLDPDSQHMTVELMEQIVADLPEQEMRDHMAPLVEHLREHGWVELMAGTPESTLFMTAAKARELDAEGQRRADEPVDVPGFRAEWERTVGVYQMSDGTEELNPVVTLWALKPAASDEDAAERYIALAQEHMQQVGRLR